MRNVLAAQILRTPAVRVLLGAVVLLAWAAQATRSSEFDADKLAAIRSRMQAFVDEHEIAGAVTVVGHKEGIVVCEAVGSLNLENQRPMPKDALFRIASMTKPITALGIMILADEGKLSLEDPVAKHLPEFRGQMLASRSGETVTLKKPARPITLRDLMTHTSGLPDRMPDGLSDLYIKRNHTLAEAVMAFSQRPLDFEPGTKWKYCNPGIDTLGRVIEVVAGQSYEDFLHRRIFQPLGMMDTTFYPTQEHLERAPPIYAKRDGKLVLAGNPIITFHEGVRYPIPAGGLFSTGADLAKFYQMMLDDGTLGSTRIVSPDTVATMTKVQTGDLSAGFTPGMGWGLGWGVVRKPSGVTEMLSPGSYGHGGAFGTQAWIDPQQDLFVILLIQRAGIPNSDASPMRQALQSLAVAALKK
jgi:CubicO group peptidase (beta-lactamase class C family)